MIYILLLIAGFAILIYGADLLIDSASALAKKLDVPDIVIGLTVVAFGTSAPELAINVFAALDKNSGIVLGNVIGSNIFNVLGILGIAAVIFPLSVRSNTTWIEIPLSLLSGIVVIILANDILIDRSSESWISRSDGLILLLFFIIFIAYNVQMAVSGNADPSTGTKNLPLPKSLILLVIGLVMLVGGGKAIVYSASNIASWIGISDRIIGLTIVSIGTSLPELATSIISVRKKNVDIAIGNAVGSNIFNAFLVLGVSAVVYPVQVEAASQFDFLVNIAAGILLFFFILNGKNLNRWNGIVFILLYLAYLVTLIIV